MFLRVLGGAAATLACGVVFACSSDSDPETPAVEEGKCAGNLEAYRFPHGGDGHADPFGAKAAGQARAGKVREQSQIVQPSTARHKVRVGDYVLANDRLAVYIEAEGRANGYSPFGGDVVAIEPVGDDGRPKGVGYYNETIVALSRQTVKPDKVSVIADGSDGQAAIVRVSGVFANVPFLDTFRALSQEEYGFPGTIDYVLAPGSEKVLIRLGVVNTTLENVDFANKQRVGFFQTSRNQIFSENVGYIQGKGDNPWVAFDGGDYAFLYRAVGKPIRSELEISGFQLYSVQGLSVDACATKEVDYLELLGGGPGIDGLLEAKRRDAKEPAWREVRGVLREQAGTPVPLAGAYVHATTADGKYLTRTRTNSAGEYVLHLPAEKVQLTPTLEGWAVPVATPVEASATTADLVLPARATIDVTATDATTTEPLPVRVQVIPTTTPVPAPESFGLREQIGGRLWQDYAVTGRSTLPVPPGSHRVVVTRGYEYEIVDATVVAETGKNATVTAPLERTVDSSGVMCADFHVHSFYSADSSDPVEAKVKGAIADGLDIPVSSEHEWVIDFQPIVQKLGMTKWAFGMPSEELTTFTWGHFGVVPLYPHEDAPNNGAVDWVGKKPAEIFRQVAELPEKPVFVINHPSGGTAFSAYFTAAALDRDKASGNPDLWSDQFGAIEVFNDSDLEANRAAALADWFALLNAGKTYWAVGSSDSHDQRSSPVGYPRTCLHFGHDDPTRLTPETVRDVLRSGAATVSGGLYMTVSGPGGAGPGATAQAGAYKIVVQAPGWLSAESLETIVDGVTVATQPLTATGAGPGKRYEATVDVAPAQSKPRHWVVFHAKGSGDLGPLHPGRKPFAASNPIFF